MTKRPTNPVRYQIRVGDKLLEVTLLSRSGGRVSFEVNGEKYDVDVSRQLSPQNSLPMHAPQAVQSAAPVVADPSAVAAPMPGLITKIMVSEGEKIVPGQTLLIIEAMKMENSINSASEGKVKKVLVSEGQEVKGGQHLLALNLLLT